MNITLLYPLLSRSRSLVDENKQYWPPLGLAYIAAVLEKNNHRVQILDRDAILHKNKLDFEKTDEITISKIMSFGTDILGISATTPNMYDVMHLCGRVKKLKPSISIVLGGPHATCEPQRTLKECEYIDIAARGEGEYTMLELADKFEPANIAGISFRKNGAVIDNPDRPMREDLDELPFAARHLLDMEFYLKPSRFIGRGLSLRTTHILSSRGCPHRCDFCAGHVMFPGKVRFHSPQRIIKEMEHLVASYPVEAVYFADDMFLTNKPRAAEFISLLKANKRLSNVKWIAQARADSIDEPTLKTLKGGNCIGLEYGFESGSQRVLDIMNKKSTVEKNLRAAALTKKAGLRFTGFIIVGYPGETETDFKKTVKFLRKASPSVISFSLFYPLPGTAIYKQLVSEGRDIPAWDRIGDPEAADINYSAMRPEKFSKLYFRTRLTLVLPNNLYYFVRDNLDHPVALARAFLTQFRGTLIKTLRSVKRLFVYGT